MDAGFAQPSEKSRRIDRLLSVVRPDDPVECDNCRGRTDRTDIDARVAVVLRACGGAVRCRLCELARATKGSAS